MKNTNVSSSIWEKDIPAIIAGFKEQGISEFTISEDSCGLIGKLAVFEANGAKVQGLTQVRTGNVKFETGEEEMIPAIMMRVMQ